MTAHNKSNTIFFCFYVCRSVPYRCVCLCVLSCSLCTDIAWSKMNKMYRERKKSNNNNGTCIWSYCFSLLHHQNSELARCKLQRKWLMKNWKTNDDDDFFNATLFLVTNTPSSSYQSTKYTHVNKMHQKNVLFYTSKCVKIQIMQYITYLLLWCAERSAMRKNIK